MFKYCAFSDYSLSNVLNDEIYMNHYESFNDPFECRCKVLTGFPKKEPSTARFQSIITAWGFNDVNDQHAIDDYDDYIFSLEGTEPCISHLIDSARISCFSKNSDNLLMWAHYADGLRGFCVEFDRELILMNSDNTSQIYEVMYKDTPSIIDTAVIAVLNDQVDYHGDAIYAAEQAIEHLGADRKSEVEMYEEHLNGIYIKNNKIYQKMLATKPTEWRHEEEIRVISQTSSAGKSGEFLNYSSAAIKSIIVGEKMPDREIQALRKLIKSHTSPIMLKKASRANGKFTIVIEDCI